jgi:hypothetical protein
MGEVGGGGGSVLEWKGLENFQEMECHLLKIPPPPPPGKRYNKNKIILSKWSSYRAVT